MYYLYNEGKKKGPYSLAQLKAFALDRSAIVWHPLTSSWTIAESIEELEIQSAHSEEIKVIIADDHVLYRAGVRAALHSKEDIHFLAEADNGLHLLQLLHSMQPDVILLDIQMPVMDGIETLPKIKQMYPRIKVIMLSMMDDQSMISKLMNSGANSYLTKMCDAEVIYQTIKTCHEKTYSFNEFTKRALNANGEPKAARSYSLPEENTYSNRQTRSFEYLHTDKTSASLYPVSPGHNNGIQTSSVIAESTSPAPVAGIGFSRAKVLETFDDATELIPEKKRNGVTRTIIDSVLISGILTALYYILQSI